MSKTRKLFLTILSIALACCVSIGLGATSTFAASELDGFSVTGASVRVAEPYGLRFHTQVPDGEKANYTFGTLIIPKIDLGNNELTIDTPNALKVTAEKWQSDTEYTVALGGKADAQGNITNFPATQYNSPILARSYALDKDTGTVVYYTNTVERTYAGVAATGLAVTEGENVITNPDTITFLNGIVDGVIKDGFALTQSELTLEVGSNEVQLNTLINGNEGLTVKWEISGDCLTVTKNAYGIITAIKAKTAGEATLTATLGSSVQTLTVNVTERAIAANEVRDFKYASDVISSPNQENVSIEFVDSFQGATGVMKVTMSARWGKFMIKPIQDLGVYENYEYVVIRMWVDSDETKNADFYTYLARRSADQIEVKSYNPVELGCWIDYYYKAQNFVEQWKEGWNSYYSAVSLSRKSTCYIDKVYVTNIYKPDGVEVNNFDTAPNNLITIGGSTTEYLPEYQGASGVLKVYAPNWSITYFPPVRSIHDYVGYTHVVFRVWADTTTCGINLNNDGLDYPVNIKKASVANQWYDYYFTFEDFKQAWSRGDSYKGFLMFNSGGTIYIDSVYMTSVPVAEGKILSFDSKAEVAQVCGKGSSTANGTFEWIESAYGANGVAKLTYNSNNDQWQAFNFKPIKPVSDYAGYTHIVIRALTIKEKEGATMYLNGGFHLGANTGVDKEPINYTGWVYDNEWKEYKFEIAPFLKAWSNDDSALIGTNDHVWFKVIANDGSTTGTGYIYIDEIYCVKEA